MRSMLLLQRTKWNSAIFAKSLISFNVGGCRKSGQLVRKPSLASTWRVSEQVSHKVIHRARGEFQKAFRIIDLTLIRRNRFDFDG
jgi:hypothetical protein